MTVRRKVLLYQPYCFDGFPRMPLPRMAVARPTPHLEAAALAPIFFWTDSRGPFASSGRAQAAAPEPSAPPPGAVDAQITQGVRDGKRRLDLVD